MTMAHRIRCTFRPQAWVDHDQLIECSPLGPTEWIATVEALPAENSYESDNLRCTPEAPSWCREWSGPFEVDYEEVPENEPSMPRYVHYFDMPVTGSFESEEEDFDKAFEILCHDKTTQQAVEHLVAHCEFFYSFNNVTPTDQVNNPEVINDRQQPLHPSRHW